MSEELNIHIPIPPDFNALFSSYTEEERIQIKKGMDQYVNLKLEESGLELTEDAKSLLGDVVLSVMKHTADALERLQNKEVAEG